MTAKHVWTYLVMLVALLLSLEIPAHPEDAASKPAGIQALVEHLARTEPCMNKIDARIRDALKSPPSGMDLRATVVWTSNRLPVDLKDAFRSAGRNFAKVMLPRDWPSEATVHPEEFARVLYRETATSFGNLPAAVINGCRLGAPDQIEESMALSLHLNGGPFDSDPDYKKKGIDIRRAFLLLLTLEGSGQAWSPSLMGSLLGDKYKQLANRYRLSSVTIDGKGYEGPPSVYAEACRKMAISASDVVRLFEHDAPLDKTTWRKKFDSAHCYIRGTAQLKGEQVIWELRSFGQGKITYPDGHVIFLWDPNEPHF